MVDKTNWETCVLCGEKIHPLQVTGAQPVADGPCCVSCHYGIVFPTIRNNGTLSKWGSKRNDRGNLVSCIVPMHPSEAERFKEKIKMMCQV